MYINNVGVFVFPYFEKKFPDPMANMKNVQEIQICTGICNGILPFHLFQHYMICTCIKNLEEQIVRNHSYEASELSSSVRDDTQGPVPILSHARTAFFNTS